MLVFLQHRWASGRGLLAALPQGVGGRQSCHTQGEWRRYKTKKWYKLQSWTFLTCDPRNAEWLVHCPQQVELGRRACTKNCCKCGCFEEIRTRAVAIAAFGLKVLPTALFQMSQSQPETDLPTKAASLFRNLDVFPKVADEARARSASGGATTLSVALCILVLVVTEARLYSSIRTDQTLEVDVSRGGKIAVDFNITFHHLPCSLMSVDSMDISGNCFILQQWL
jgi:hypothetical protein